MSDGSPLVHVCRFEFAGFCACGRRGDASNETDARPDRLAEIAKRFDIEGIEGLWSSDVAWLIAEIERLRGGTK